MADVTAQAAPALRAIDSLILDMESVNISATEAAAWTDVVESLHVRTEALRLAMRRRRLHIYAEATLPVGASACQTRCVSFCKPERAPNHCKLCRCGACSFCSAGGNHTERAASLAASPPAAPDASDRWA